VVAAEIGANVVEWNRRTFAAVNGAAVEDPRLEVVLDDEVAVLRSTPRTWDLVLLDVDNRPGWLAVPGNAVLYSPSGLTAARTTLRPGGVLAVWSPGANAALHDAWPGPSVGSKRSAPRPSAGPRRNRPA